MRIPPWYHYFDGKYIDNVVEIPYSTLISEKQVSDNRLTIEEQREPIENPVVLGNLVQHEMFIFLHEKKALDQGGTPCTPCMMCSQDRYVYLQNGQIHEVCHPNAWERPVQRITASLTWSKN